MLFFSLFFYIRHLNLEDFFSRGVTHVFTDRLGRDGQEAHFGFYLLFFFHFVSSLYFYWGGGICEGAVGELHASICFYFLVPVLPPSCFKIKRDQSFFVFFFTLHTHSIFVLLLIHVKL